MLVSPGVAAGTSKEQLAEFALMVLRMQLIFAGQITAYDPEISWADPVGVVGVEDVSVTVTVHDAIWSMTTERALHAILVAVVFRGVSFRLNVPELPPCIESSG
jgi:hypothetical protein